MLKNSIILMLLAAILLMAIEETRAESKKRSVEDSNESSSLYDYDDEDKKKRSESFSPRERAEKIELFKELIDRLSHKLDRNEQSNYKSYLVRPRIQDQNMSGPLDSNEFGSEYDSDEDDIERKKKSLMKKKRFREYFRKRNFQNRMKKFRANY